jgi:hypothetical protein
LPEIELIACEIDSVLHEIELISNAIDLILCQPRRAWFTTPTKVHGVVNHALHDFLRSRVPLELPDLFCNEARGHRMANQSRSEKSLCLIRDDQFIPPIASFWLAIPFVFQFLWRPNLRLANDFVPCNIIDATKYLVFGNVQTPMDLRIAGAMSMVTDGVAPDYLTVRLSNFIPKSVVCVLDSIDFHIKVGF